MKYIGDPRIVWGIRAVWLSLCLTTIHCGPTYAGGVPGNRSDIESLRHALEARTRNEEPDQSVTRIDLRGYNWHRRIDPSPSIRVVAASYHRRGELFLFDAGGSLLKRLKTHELTWLQLFDFDLDGIDEIITEEIDGSGTGVIIKSYHIYRISQADIEPLWEGVSYSRKWFGKDPETGESKVEMIRGYLRYEPSANGRPTTRLLHLQEVREPGEEVVRISRQGYHLTKEGFQPVPWPPS